MRLRHRLFVVGTTAVLAACGKGSSRDGAGSGSAPVAVEARLDAGAAITAPPAIDASFADGTLQLVGIDVLTAPALFQSRAAGAGAKPMEPLVVAAKAAVAAIDGQQPGKLGDAVIVWVAIRPGRKVRAWVACPGQPDADAARVAIAGRMALAAGPEVSGPVAFAVTFDRSGQRPRSHDIPMPPELEAVRAAAGPAPTPEALIERAWKP